MLLLFIALAFDHASVCDILLAFLVLLFPAFLILA